MQCRLYEIKPFFSKLAGWVYAIFMNASSISILDGAKKLSLNEKERGFPMGLRVMSEPDGAGSCILHIPSSFDSVQIRDGQSKALTGVEVMMTK